MWRFAFPARNFGTQVFTDKKIVCFKKAKLASINNYITLGLNYHLLSCEEYPLQRNHYC